MVKSVNYFRLTNLTNKLGWLALIIIMLNFSGCNYNMVQNNGSRPDKKVELHKYNIPNGIFIDAKLNENELLATDNSLKVIYSFNFKNGKLTKLINVNNKLNYIHSIACNSKWVLWVENETQIADTQNKPYRWELIAKNIISGEQILIDKSNFISNKFDVPMFINFTPDKINITSENKIIYCKTLQSGKDITSEVDLFDLDSRKNTVISRSKNNVLSELIANCGIYKNIAVWSKYRELNEPTYAKRLTQYLYSELFEYDLVSKTTSQITQNSFFDEPNLFENKLVCIEVPGRKAQQVTCESNVVQISIDNNERKTLVNNASDCYKGVENELYRTMPTISSQYISWYHLGGQDNRFLFDYKKNQFIEIYKSVEDVQNNTVISKMFDNLVILYDNRENGVSNGYCIIVN